MRNASGHQCKEKMSGREKKVNEKMPELQIQNRDTTFSA